MSNKKRFVPPEVIERGARDDDCDVRKAAMIAAKNRADIPPEVIERWARDNDWRIRKVAMIAAQNRADIPPIRTIEPPPVVYKRCVADVIVVAEIPPDAQVRGDFGSKCRASKAIIKEVIGDFCGEKVGISIYDKKTTYYAGDEIEIENFDYSDNECSSGFHFFCTKEEAENYK